MKADLALLKAELAQANANAKASLYEKINRLNAKIQQQLESAKERREFAESEVQAHAKLLREEAGRVRKESDRKEEPLSACMNIEVPNQMRKVPVDPPFLENSHAISSPTCSFLTSFDRAGQPRATLVHSRVLLTAI